MKYFIFFLSFSTLLFSQYFPTYVKTYAPGIDFEQEREGIIYSFSFSSKLLAYSNQNIWALSPFGINKIYLNQENKIEFENKYSFYGEPEEIFGIKDGLIVKDKENRFFVFKIENENLKLTGNLEIPNIYKIWENSEYIVFDTYSIKRFRVYKWKNEELKKISEFDFNEGRIIGLCDGEYLYFYGLEIIGGIFAHPIFEESKDFLRENYFVPLENLDGYVVGGQAYSKYLYLISKKGDNYYLNIYENFPDPLKPKFKGKVALGKFITYEILLNYDSSKIILFDKDYKYRIADISNPENIILGSEFSDKETNLMRKTTKIYIEDKIFCLGSEMNYCYYENDGIYTPFLLKDCKIPPYFISADAEAISGNYFIEMFLKMKKFYLYYVNGKANPETNFKFEKEINFPSCASELIPDEIPPYFFSKLIFNNDKIAILLNKDVIISNLNGEGICIPLPWILGNYYYDILFKNNKMFIFQGDKGLLIYNIENLNNPYLEKKIENPDVINFYLINEKYFVFMTYREIYKDIRVTDFEIWRYDCEEPHITDRLTNYLFLEDPYYYYKTALYQDWIYISSYYYYYKTSPTPYYIKILPCRVNSEGRWELSNFTLFAGDLNGYMPFYYFYNNKYYFADLRDPGRPRLADIRKVPGNINNIYYELDTVIFKTNKGYAIYNPQGTRIPEELPFGWVDFPSQGEIIDSSVLDIYGWAIDADGDGIGNIFVYIDLEEVYSLNYGFKRQDVAEAKPDFTEAINSGFSGRAYLLDFPSGWHRLTVVAIDREGRPGIIGIRDFYKKEEDK